MKLGDKVKDNISGFEGTLIAKAIYLHGNTRCLVQGGLYEGKPIESWFDETQLGDPITDEKDTPSTDTKKEKKAVKKDSDKPKKQKKAPDPEPEEDDDDLFDDSDDTETELTADDVRKALKAYSKEHDKNKAMKKIKKYADSGKIADLDPDDYASLIADLS